MKLVVYTAILHDRPLADAPDVIASLGLNAAEINAGGFLPPMHIPIDDIASQTARDDYLGIFEDKGIVLAGLNANGNPLHPNPIIGEKHAADLKRAIRAASALGQTRVVTMSGLPGGEPGSVRPQLDRQCLELRRPRRARVPMGPGRRAFLEGNRPAGRRQRRDGGDRDASAERRLQPADPQTCDRADRRNQRGTDQTTISVGDFARWSGEEWVAQMPAHASRERTRKGRQ